MRGPRHYTFVACRFNNTTILFLPRWKAMRAWSASALHVGLSTMHLLKCGPVKTKGPHIQAFQNSSNLGPGRAPWLAQNLAQDLVQGGQKSLPKSWSKLASRGPKMAAVILAISARALFAQARNRQDLSTHFWSP